MRSRRHGWNRGRRSARRFRVETGGATMYNRIRVAIDTTPYENNPALQRAERFAKMAGSTVYLLHMARGHIVPMNIIGGSSRAVVTAEDDAASLDRQVVQ